MEDWRVNPGNLPPPSPDSGLDNYLAAHSDAAALVPRPCDRKPPAPAPSPKHAIAHLGYERGSKVIFGIISSCVLRFLRFFSLRGVIREAVWLPGRAFA